MSAETRGCTCGGRPEEIGGAAHRVGCGDPEFEQISATCYVTPDWRIVIERISADEWQLTDCGRFIKRFATDTEALAWTARWLRGEDLR